MIYLKTFKLSSSKIKNNNIYPFNVLNNKEPNIFLFDNITVLYGNNGSGKSTILNIIAHKLNLKGKERSNPKVIGTLDYFEDYASKCCYELGETENNKKINKIPENSRYIKSEEILYEIRKIQQDAILQESIKSNLARERGVEEADSLYLLDEPEVSLSPQNQVKLAEELNKMSRYLGVQFIIATHSPFMLGILNAKIYDLDTKDYRVKKWNELENVKYFYEFFKSRSREFDN